MAEKDIVLNEEQIKALGWLMKDDQNVAVTRLLNCFSCKQALINLNGRDVWAFLNGGKKLTYKTATIKKARKKENVWSHDQTFSYYRATAGQIQDFSWAYRRLILLVASFRVRYIDGPTCVIRESIYRQGTGILHRWGSWSRDEDTHLLWEVGSSFRMGDGVIKGRRRGGPSHCRGVSGVTQVASSGMMRPCQPIAHTPVFGYDFPEIIHCVLKG